MALAYLRPAKDVEIGVRQDQVIDDIEAANTTTCLERLCEAKRRRTVS